MSHLISLIREYNPGTPVALLPGIIFIIQNASDSLIIPVSTIIRQIPWRSLVYTSKNLADETAAVYLRQFFLQLPDFVFLFIVEWHRWMPKGCFIPGSWPELLFQLLLLLFQHLDFLVNFIRICDPLPFPPSGQPVFLSLFLCSQFWNNRSLH